MDKEQFTKILKEYGYSDYWIELLWKDRPADHFGSEESIRITAREMKPIIDMADAKRN